LDESRSSNTSNSERGTSPQTKKHQKVKKPNKPHHTTWWPALLQIPVVLVHVAPHVHHLPGLRMDRSLPQPMLIDGTSTKLCTCEGCHLPIWSLLMQTYCSLALQGFPLAGSLARPCHTSYHKDCYQDDAPFNTWLPANRGLTSPPGIHEWPHFIYEACTVHSVVDHELS
jgi:hypothetical protein